MEIKAETLYRLADKTTGSPATGCGTMTQAPDSTTTAEAAALRRAARALIAGMLAELVHQDQDWIGACRKRIKDRMSNAKHVIYNNERKIGLMLLGHMDQIAALESRNRQMEHTALVCRHALEILDDMGTHAAHTPALQPQSLAAHRPSMAPATRVSHHPH